MTYISTFRNGIERLITSEQEVSREVVDDSLTGLEAFSERVWGDDVHGSATYQDIRGAVYKNSMRLERIYTETCFPNRSLQDIKGVVLSYAQTRIMKEAYKISEEVLGDEAQSINVDGYIVDITLAEELYL